MVNRIPALALLALACADSARALPILSADGSLLSGVDVPG